MRIEKAILGSLAAAALFGAGPLDARASEPVATAQNAVASPAGWNLAGSKPEAYAVGTTVPTTELSLAKTLPQRPVNLGFDD
ncbi:hypothetical protein WME73_35710 [Sorangium sp. So ce302]|uniref:hypothetical protein n=1 Tax=unclassified Sorangium TaxID=2621164 RepID=UPI003F61E4A2